MAKKTFVFSYGTLSIVGIGIVIGLLMAFVSTVVVHETSGKNFCGVCHTMKPMIDAYKLDVHGGASEHGMEVKCVSCHLPHDSLINYLWTKMKTGLHDVYAQSFYDLDKIDWIGKRKDREHFVYDSACLECHTNLQKATMPNKKAFNGHRAYFSNKGEKTCVSCHENVGHKDLGYHLSERYLSKLIKEKTNVKNKEK